MQIILANIVAFVTREARSLLIIAIVIGIIFIWEKLSEKEGYYRWLVKINPNDLQALKNLGYAYARMNKNIEAEQLFRQAIAKDPNDPWLYQYLGIVLHQMDGHQLEAERAYRNAIEIDPTNSESYYNLGLLLHGNPKRYQEAEKAYNNAIKINPDFSYPYTNLSNLLAELGRFQEAEEAYRKAINLDSNNPSIYNSFSNLLRKLGRSEDALTIMHKALEIAPNEFIINLGIASIQRSLGNDEEAKRFIEKSRNLIKEGDHDYLYNLTCIEAIIENNELAFQYLREAAEENKLDREWAWEDPDLEWIRDDPRFIEIVGPKPEK
jgi:Flp pilus assembly protein TadD